MSLGEISNDDQLFERGFCPVEPAYRQKNEVSLSNSAASSTVSMSEFVVVIFI